MAETWFNVNDGKLIVGNAAYEQIVEQTHPGDIVPLPELLTQADFPYQPGDYAPKWSRHVWSREEKIQLGHWALKLLEEAAGEPQILKTIPHIERLHILGLSPSAGAWREFGGFDKFRNIIGSPMQEYYRFENWSLKDFVDYAHSLESKLGRMPSRQDYRDAKGPSIDMLDRRMGGIRKLNDYLGYPNVHAWDKDDFVSWGVKVVEVNGPELFVPTAIRTLSKRNRGPSAPTIINRFDRWSTYKQTVLEEYYWRQEGSAYEEAAKLSRYQSLIDEEILPAEYQAMDHQEFFAHAARYLLISECAPGISEKMKFTLMQQPSNKLISGIRKINSTLTAGQIEVIASAGNIFEDIWPFNYDAIHLLINQEELKTEREMHKNRQRYKQI